MSPSTCTTCAIERMHPLAALCSDCGEPLDGVTPEGRRFVLVCACGGRVLRLDGGVISCGQCGAHGVSESEAT